MYARTFTPVSILTIYETGWSWNSDSQPHQDRPNRSGKPHLQKPFFSIQRIHCDLSSASLATTQTIRENFGLLQLFANSNSFLLLTSRQAQCLPIVLFDFCVAVTQKAKPCAASPISQIRARP